MIWIDNINQLEYYNASEVWDCYCDPLIYPNDLLLQAQLGTGPGSGTYAVTVHALSTDGLTDYGDVTSSFSWYVAHFVKDGTTYMYANIMLNSFANEMLSNECFILEVKVTQSGTTIFDKYTQRYDVSSAVVYASGITVEQSQTQIGYVCSVPAPRDLCHKTYKQFAAKFDCIDLFTGDYYDQPGTVYAVGNISGYDVPDYVWFSFFRLSNISATLKKLPYEIKRTISYNCRTQKTESTEKYLFNGRNVTFPQWKVEEIEAMMRANHLYVDGVEYQSEGGTIFEQLEKVVRNCVYRYKMSIPLQGCYEFQIFGCAPNCSNLASYYAIHNSAAQYYSDARRLVASDVPSLMTYFRSLPGTVSVTQAMGVSPCDLYAVLCVQSTGILPAYIFADATTPNSRIYPRQAKLGLTDFSMFCGTSAASTCVVPQMGTIVSVAQVCASPVVGTIASMPDNISATLTITGENGWTTGVQGNSGVNINGLITLNINVNNSAFNQVQGQDFFASLLIAHVSELGQPVAPVAITNGLPANALLYIDTNGDIYYTGYPTTENGSGSAIVLTNIQYNR